MKFLVNKTNTLQGDVRVPGNKSGTARSIILGSLANGITRVYNPLLNLDSFSIINMFRAMGVKIDTSNPQIWIIEGSCGNLKVPEAVLDALNASGAEIFSTRNSGLAPLGINSQ